MASQASGLPPGFVLDPVTPAPPVYTPPATERRGRPRLPAPQTDLQRQLEEERLRRERAERLAGTVPSGYRRTPEGGLEPVPGGPVSNPEAASGEQARIGGLYLRAARANNLYLQNQVDPRGLVGQTLADYFPRLANVNAGPERQVSEADQRDFVSAVLRFETGANMPIPEIDEARVRYFPQPGDSPEVIAEKAALRLNAIEGMRRAAGPASHNVDTGIPSDRQTPMVRAGAHMLDAAVAALRDGQPPPLAPVNAPGDPTRTDPRESGAAAGVAQQADQHLNGAGAGSSLYAGPITRQFLGEQQAAANDANVTREQFNALLQRQHRELTQVYEAAGRAAPGLSIPQIGPAQGVPDDLWRRIEEGRRAGRVPNLTPEPLDVQQPETRAGQVFSDAMGNSSDTAAVASAADSASLGLPALFSADYRQRMGRLRADHPIASTIGAVVGGIVAPGGPRAGMNLLQQTGRSAAQGGVYAFNESGGDPAAAALGIGLGAAAPGAFNIAGRGVRAVRGAFTPTADVAGAEAVSIANALNEENIPGSRPLLDPSTRTRAAYLESQRGSGGPVRQSLAATRAGVEAGVERIGAGGTAEPLGVMGTRLQDRLLRDHRQQGAAAGRVYDAADAMAAQEGAPGIRAIETVAQLDNTLTRLRRNAPANQPIIDYLESVRANFVDAEGNLVTKSIADIRDIRTSVSGAINHRNLARTRAEHYVNEALDAAKVDVTRDFGTSAPEALRLYSRADGMWTARHANRRQILDKLIGRDMENPISGEQVMARLQTMAGNRGDVARLERMWQRLGPEEQLDTAATLAESAITRSPDEGFQLQNFVNWARTFSTEGRRVIFGPEASRSIGNLVRITKALQATEGELNRSRSGVVRNWAGAFKDFTRGGPVGMAAGLVSGGSLLASGAAGAAIGATTSLGGMVLRRLSARALMSPDLSRWLAAAPRATTATAISSHIDRLQVIARTQRNPAIAQEILGLRQGLLNAVNDNVPQAGRMAASPNEGPDQPDQ